ncbi:ABC transporter permease [Chitinimonas lacunae]|uniref:Transport permease protein n=1 Tax=Chitinimonas lacunae TaxID=1963018 RepID=A0ABV8ML98_9NEIS
MNIKVIAYQLVLEIKRYGRDRMGAFWTFAFPFLMLYLFMWMYGGDKYGLSNSYLVAGMVGMTIIATCLFGFAVVLVDLRAREVFKMFHLFPLGRVDYLLAFVLSRVIILTGFSVFYLLVAHAIYGLDLRADWGQWLAIVSLLLMGSITFLAFGLALSSRLSSVTAATGLTNLLYFPLIFLSDLFYPQQGLPSWVAQAINLFPLTDFVNALRGAIAPTVEWSRIGELMPKLLIWTTVSLLLTVYGFRWHNKRNND